MSVSLLIYPHRLRDGSEYLLRAPSQTLMNEWVFKLQQNSGEQPLLAEPGPSSIQSPWVYSPCQALWYVRGQERSGTALSDRGILLTCFGTTVLCQAGLGGFVFTPHTQLSLRNSTTDVSGASAAKSQCQENCDCALVFLPLLCGAWKLLACPLDGKTHNAALPSCCSAHTQRCVGFTMKS